MKQTLTYILIPLICAVLVYLATAFIIFSFDLSGTRPIDRGVVVFIWVSISLVLISVKKYQL